MYQNKSFKIIKLQINNLLAKFGYQIAKINKIQFDPIIDRDADFMSIYNQIRDYTMTSREQCFSLYMSTKYIIKANIPGDFVECGVWKGGNCMLIAETLKKLNATDKKIYLYDTYEGMSEPRDIDFSIEDSKDTAILEWNKNKRESHNNWCHASLEEVENNMNKTNYPKNNIHYVKGMVEDTIPSTTPEQISLLRLDTDWYESTKHELTYLYPKISKLGVLIIDDYGTWAGSKKAVDEYFEKIPILLNRIDSGNRLAIKV